MKRHAGIAGVLITALAFLGLMANWHKVNTTKRGVTDSEPLVVHGRTSRAGLPIKLTANLSVAELPENAIELLTGSGHLDSASYFNCRITNASRWTVAELRFRIRAVETHGMERWERHYRESIRIPPGTNAFVRFKVTEGGSGAIAEWEIAAGRGCPPH